MKERLILSWAIVLLSIMVSCSKDAEIIEKNSPTGPTGSTTFNFPKSEVFTFSSGGTDIKGRIYIPDAYESNKDLPSIYLLDYQEQHFAVTTDEAEQVIRGIRMISDFDALVVTLDAHLNIDATARDFKDHYNIFKDMALYVSENYTDNDSRTFIGKGSEGGVVLLSLLFEDQASSVFSNFINTDSPSGFNNTAMEMIRSNKVPTDLLNKKLHFSFSTSNDRNNCLELINTIKEAQYPWLKFESREYTTTDYNITYKASFAEALKFVFKD